MAEFKIPELGEGIEAGVVVGVLVAAGDEVSKDQPVLELETDKAVVEVPSSMSGTVKQILIKPGDKARVGQAVIVFEDSGSYEPAVATQAAEAAELEPAAPPAAQTPEPAAPSLTSPTSALDTRNSQLGTPPSEPGTRNSVLGSPPTLAHKKSAGGVKAAPSVRKLARELGIDISQVPGGGPGGRITIPDVKQFARSLNVSSAGLIHSGTSSAIAAPPLPDFSKWGAIERKAMSTVRRKTADHMTVSWATIPHVTQHDKADITELEDMRNRFKHKAEELGGKLTITAILLKVVAVALKRFPQFNASVDLETSEVVYKQYYHIGVAVDTDRGLLVPVIRDVDKKNIIELAVDLKVMSEKARSGKIALDDLRGGTFTVTNLGSIGGSHFSPIINFPEVAILGVGQGNIEPVYRFGQFAPRLILPLSLSYDHRLIDGADGARFLRWISDSLQQPLQMSI